jgi:hypothetical protein
MKLTPKVILEGTRLTGKTDLAFALNEHPRLVGSRRYRYHSPLISAEWCGFTNTPWGRGLINFEPDETARARWLEERLKPLNFAIVLCTRPDDTFEQARAERLKVSGNPKQYDDLRPFVDEQNRLRELARQSILPVSKQGPDEVANWLAANDLLAL